MEDANKTSPAKEWHWHCTWHHVLDDGKRFDLSLCAGREEGPDLSCDTPSRSTSRPSDLSWCHPQANRFPLSECLAFLSFGRAARVTSAAGASNVQPGGGSHLCQAGQTDEGRGCASWPGLFDMKTKASRGIEIAGPRRQLSDFFLDARLGTRIFRFSFPSQKLADVQH